MNCNCNKKIKLLLKPLKKCSDYKKIYNTKNISQEEKVKAIKKYIYCNKFTENNKVSF